MKLKRFQEVPHTYQMALVKSELVKGLARWFGGEELATQPEDFEFVLGTHRKVGGENSAEWSSILHTGTLAQYYLRQEGILGRM